MSDTLFPPPAAIAANAHVDAAKYQAMYQRSIEDPDGFWAEHG
ncbi:MAG: acetyl-coenzyme A synthetase N-terminal domain-containing protein, partial [Alphaproteobacteria bacterium]